MGMLDFLKKPKEEESFTETIPNAKLHIIAGGAHGALEKIRRSIAQEELP